jgi:hypothetical protein
MWHKYPKTFHLPWSEGITNDDKVMTNNPFSGKRVIITEKMDGENTSLYHDHIHARSLDSPHHPSRDWVKRFWSTVRHEIPRGMRICGENVYAKHSIGYNNLNSFFLGFSVWTGPTCMGWDQTVEWFDLLGITPVPVLYDGTFSKRIHFQLLERLDFERNEGYVIRLADQFNVDDFTHCVGKFVRPNHVQTDEHWMNGPITPNRLKDE